MEVVLAEAVGGVLVVLVGGSQQCQSVLGGELKFHEHDTPIVWISSEKLSGEHMLCSLNSWSHRYSGKGNLLKIFLSNAHPILNPILL